MNGTRTILAEVEGAPFGRRVRAIAHLRGVRLSELAQCLDISSGHFANCLDGRRGFSEPDLSTLSEALRVPPALLAHGESKPTPPWRGASYGSYGALAYEAGTPARLVCDRFSMVLRCVTSPSFVPPLLGALLSRCGAMAVETRRSSGYRRAHRVDGLYIQSDHLYPSGAPVRFEVSPRHMTGRAWAVLSPLVDSEQFPHRVTRVDVAVDYDASRATVELLGLRQTSGRFEFIADSSEPWSSLRLSARAGAPRSGRHFRLYRHPYDAVEGDPHWTRLEAQIRRRTTLGDLPELADPFGAVKVCVLRESAMEYPDGLVLADLGRFGWLYVRDRLGPARYSAFVARAPGLDDLRLPGPSEVFTAGWSSVVGGIFESLRAGAHFAV